MLPCFVETMVVAELREPVEAGHLVGADRAAELDVVEHEVVHRGLREVGDDLHASPSGPLTSPLDRDDDERGLAAT